MLARKKILIDSYIGVNTSEQPDHPFKPNGISYFYQLDQPISVLRV